MTMRERGMYAPRQQWQSLQIHPAAIFLSLSQTRCQAVSRYTTRYFKSEDVRMYNRRQKWDLKRQYTRGFISKSSSSTNHYHCLIQGTNVLITLHTYRLRTTRSQPRARKLNRTSTLQSDPPSSRLHHPLFASLTARNKPIHYPNTLPTHLTQRSPTCPHSALPLSDRVS
ncbi:hypothetical protein BDW22DRAFT_858561 [Trametopsis cervina]|nr:hypothetical protein BDW22DRAFT_858561 [Trametopsis cervina]